MRKAKVLSLSFGALLLIGLPFSSLLTHDSPAEPAAPLSATAQVLEPVLAQQSALEGVYRQWQAQHVKSGGDRHVVVGLGWARGLSHEYNSAVGRMDLDLIGGTLTAEVQGLKFPADVWLVDNQEGPGKSVMPEKGDRMVRLGSLKGNDYVSRLSASLGEGFFNDFELDLAVVTRPGKSPAEGSVLYGTRSFFERTYTESRIAAEREAENGLTKLLSPRSIASMLSPRPAEANSGTLVSHGLVSQRVAQGGDLFFRGKFNGNGRTCGTCHPVDNNQHLDQEFIDSLPADDKLFVAELPVSSGGVPGLERPALMRNAALILENVDGAQNPTVKFAMRGVPHSLSMATSIKAPVADGSQRTGWSGDGAPAPNTLRLFSAGAVFQHFTKRLNRVAGVDFVLPTDAQLDAMEAFMLSCGRLNELNLASVTLTSASANAGRLIFLDANKGKCNGCHGNAGANIAGNINLNFDTGVETVTHPARAIENFPFDGGFGVAPRDCNGDAVNDCFGDATFNATPVIEAADTAPFFHNNVAETVEDAVEFYTTANFTNSPSGQFGGPIVLNQTEINQVANFLRVINAGFNMSISIQRNSAALTLENNANTGTLSQILARRQTTDTLLLLSNAEISDAIDVLAEKGLHSTAVLHLFTALTKNTQALIELSSSRRKQLITEARTSITTAKNQLGTGLNFTLGEGNLMF